MFWLRLEGDHHHSGAGAMVGGHWWDLGRSGSRGKGDAGAQHAFFRIPANAGVLFTLRAISSRLTVSGNALRVTPRGVPH